MRESNLERLESPLNSVGHVVDECPICNRIGSSKSRPCSLHQEAMRNLDSQYEAWRSAMGGDLSRNEYYKCLLALGETGTAVKQAIEYLRGTEPESV